MSGVKRVEHGSVPEFHGQTVEVFSETDGDGTFAGCVSIGNRVATFSAEEGSGMQALGELIDALESMRARLKLDARW